MKMHIDYRQCKKYIEIGRKCRSDTIASQKFEGFERCSSNNKYLFKISEGFGMELWDIETCTRMYIRF